MKSTHIDYSMAGRASRSCSSNKDAKILENVRHIIDDEKGSTRSKLPVSIDKPRRSSGNDNLGIDHYSKSTSSPSKEHQSYSSIQGLMNIPSYFYSCYNDDRTPGSQSQGFERQTSIRGADIFNNTPMSSTTAMSSDIHHPAEQGGITPQLSSGHVANSKKGTSAFLSPDRQRIVRQQYDPSMVLNTNPPVGLYSPVYTAVECPLTPSITIPKAQRKVSGNPLNREHRGSKRSSNISSGSVEHGQDQVKGKRNVSISTGIGNSLLSKGVEVKTAVQGNSHNANTMPTWYFMPRYAPSCRISEPQTSNELSIACKTTNISDNDINRSAYNNRYFMHGSEKVLCNMGKETGRSEHPRAISVDVMYNPKIIEKKSPGWTLADFRRQSDNSIETPIRTSRQIESIHVPISVNADKQYIKNKFKSVPFIVNMRKGASSECSYNTSSQMGVKSQTTDISPGPFVSTRSTIEAEIKNKFPDRSNSVPFDKITGRKEAKYAPSQFLCYDVDRSIADKHIPSPIFALSPKRKCNCVGIDVSSEANHTTPHRTLKSSSAMANLMDITSQYDWTDSSMNRKKLSYNISFDKMISRHQCERTGRTRPPVMTTISADLDTTCDALALPSNYVSRIKGNVSMSNHVSRSRRERLMCPPKDSHDLAYQYDINSIKPTIRKGISFDHVVSRCGREKSQWRI